MFGVNLSEILLIMVISLVVFGPKQIIQITKKFILIINNVKNYILKSKNELFEYSGINDLQIVKNTLENSYFDLYNNIKINNVTSINCNTLIENENFYQPELNFEYEPELFD